MSVVDHLLRSRTNIFYEMAELAYRDITSEPSLKIVESFQTGTLAIPVLNSSSLKSRLSTVPHHRVFQFIIRAQHTVTLFELC